MSTRRTTTFRFAVAVIVCGAVIPAAQTPGSDPFAPLKPLAGSWRGEQSGQPGTGTAERTFAFVMNDRYLEVRNKSTYPPQEKNPKGEVHEDRGMISYDRARKKLVYRQFHVEGFVNTYVQVDSADPRTVIFESESIENIPAGWRARETWTIGNNSLTERFELAEPGKDFTVYSASSFRRVP